MGNVFPGVLSRRSSFLGEGFLDGALVEPFSPSSCERSLVPTAAYGKSWLVRFVERLQNHRLVCRCSVLAEQEFSEGSSRD